MQILLLLVWTAKILKANTQYKYYKWWHKFKSLIIHHFACLPLCRHHYRRVQSIWVGKWIVSMKTYIHTYIHTQVKLLSVKGQETDCHFAVKYQTNYFRILCMESATNENSFVLCRVTWWVCENIAQTVAQQVFCQN
jgi:hypothetical protein